MNLNRTANQLGKVLSLLLIYSLSADAKDLVWGFNAHRYINIHAVDYLPEEMSFFNSHRAFLETNSTYPDSPADPNPGYFHYFDIDFYPEFFNGTFPHDIDDLIAIYGLSTVIDNGTVPWIVEEWTDSLSALMAAGDWDNVWQIAAELGHYVADSHEPLHLTLNFNGGVTGNFGIHSRYETQLIGRHLAEISLPSDTSIVWENIIDSTFGYIELLYPYVDLIIAADDLAVAVDPDYGNTYYDLLWTELDSITTDAVQRGIIDLASLWRTAWVNAGKPLPPGVSVNWEDNSQPNGFRLYDNYPNPFNPLTTISYSIPKASNVSLIIYDLIGQEVARLVDNKKPAGQHRVTWNATDIASGVYLYRLQVSPPTAGFVQTKKMVLLK